MDRLWTPWRFDYISKVDQAKSCVFCSILEESEDSSNFVLYKNKLPILDISVMTVIIITSYALVLELADRHG